MFLTSFNNMFAFFMVASIPIPALRLFSLQVCVDSRSYMKSIDDHTADVTNHYRPSNIFARTRLVLTPQVPEYSPAKTVEYPRMLPNFQNCACREKYVKDNKHNSLHLTS